MLACGVRERRSDGKLPAHVITYLTLALTLFPEDDYREVATKVTGSLDRWGLLERQLVGADRVGGHPGPETVWAGDVVVELFERCCGPIAGRSNATCPSSISFRVTGLAIAHSVTAAHPPDQPITSAVRGGASLDEVYDNAPAVCVILYK